jgi:quercetin dioxygenase-like cupin family protein
MRAGWTDHHPHTETNVVLDGRLHVECQGVTVVAGPGDTVQVPAGRAGRYWAPEYARMLAVYGPNPAAEESDLVDNRRVAGDLRPPAGHVRFPRP